jgi:hypothetical protein
MKKKKKRNDEGQQVAAEKKRRKNRKKKKEAGEREFVGEKERKNRVFLIATSIRDWGFVCGPILMKF